MAEDVIEGVINFIQVVDDPMGAFHQCFFRFKTVTEINTLELVYQVRNDHIGIDEASKEANKAKHGNTETSSILAQFYEVILGSVVL